MAKIEQEQLTEFLGAVRTVLSFDDSLSLDEALGHVANNALLIFQMAVVFRDRLRLGWTDAVAFFGDLMDRHDKPIEKEEP